MVGYIIIVNTLTHYSKIKNGLRQNTIISNYYGQMNSSGTTYYTAHHYHSRLFPDVYSHMWSPAWKVSALARGDCFSHIYFDNYIYFSNNY